MFSYLRGNKGCYIPRVFMLDISSELIMHCKNEKRQAQHELYKRCYGWMMGICKRYIENDLDQQSLVNDAFLKVFTNISTYREEVPFHMWIRKILINCIIDNYRKEKNYKEAIQHKGDDVLLKYSPSDDEITGKYDMEYLLNTINQLPNATRLVFNMYVIDGYNHEEIAKILGISSGTSKWHLSNARQKLSAMLGIKANSNEHQKLSA